MSMHKLIGQCVLGLSLIAFIFLALFYLIPFYFYPNFPEYFGYYDFYTNCKKIKEGMSLSEVKTQMKSFIEVGKSWQTTDESQAWLMSATFNSSETKADHNSRIIFIPDNKNLADWCIVYPSGNVVSHIEISAD